LYVRLEQRRALQYAAATLLVAIIGLGVARSYTRAPAWHDNDSLFRQAVKDSPESYRAHFMLGVHLFENQRKTEGEKYYRQALKLFPYDPMMALALAEEYRGAGMCQPAITLYRWLFTLQPNSNRGHLGFADCLLMTYQLDAARDEALRSIRAGGRVKPAREVIDAAKRAKESMARRARGDTLAPVIPAAQPR